jgi:hypothetical protein
VIGIESVIDELRRQNAEQRELLTNLSESKSLRSPFLSLSHIPSAAWRADCERHHEETINSVRSTAQEQVPFNVQGVSTFLCCNIRPLIIDCSISMNSARLWLQRSECY